MTQADYLPLREATFFILVCLADAPKHGYAILKEVEALSDGRIILSTGTLYGAIKRLLEQGWIERLDGDDTDGRDKKSYCLTDLGRRVLKAESNRLAHVAMLSQQVLSRGNG
ncbi:MAG: helix-turn-helix transcriptional regulator [Anaerolineae bacterium]|nr:helix-turn-helix transcriptional regulator [Anaerolineae bacterium]MCA9891477.1 helix-turn-helix transcriptional regulator [Anaerolineae bacterium]